MQNEPQGKGWPSVESLAPVGLGVIIFSHKSNARTARSQRSVSSIANEGDPDRGGGMIMSISRSPDYLWAHRSISALNSDVARVHLCVVKPIRCFRPYTYHRHEPAELRATLLTSSRAIREHSDAEHGRHGNIERRSPGGHTLYGEAKLARPRWRRAKHLRTASTARSLASSRGARQQRRRRQIQSGLQALRHKRTQQLSPPPALKTARHRRLGPRRNHPPILANPCPKRPGSL